MHPDYSFDGRAKTSHAVAKTNASMPRTLFVTTALPYANGPFHIGHIGIYIQADIWVRFQRMQGHAVHFVCADDTRCADRTFNAEKQRISPEQLIEKIHKVAHNADWPRF